MIIERINLSDTTGAYMETYLLSPSDQLHIGALRPVVLVCPGGAYIRTSDQEAEQVALRFNALGYHSAVIRYSCGDKALWPNPLLELATAIRIFRERAAEWFVRSDKIALCGFSAGGHLCSMLSTKYKETAEIMQISPELIMPNAAILGYPLIDLTVEMSKSELGPYTVGDVDPEHPERSVTPMYQKALCKVGDQYMLDFSQLMFSYLLGNAHPDESQKVSLSAHLFVSAGTCPAFVWNTANDELVPVINSVEYVTALLQNGVPCEYHMFVQGWHGLSLADETVAVNENMINLDVAEWFKLCKAWMKRLDFTWK